MTRQEAEEIDKKVWAGVHALAKRSLTPGQLVTDEDVILNPTRWQRFRAWLGRGWRRLKEASA